MIARSATAVDDVIGDGTTTQVLIVGELMYQAQRWLDEGIHPTSITTGFDLARKKALEILESDFKKPVDGIDRHMLSSIAQTSLRSKVEPQLADKLTEMVTSAVLAIRRENKPIDLFMVEIMTMQHRKQMDTRLVEGIVLDHGARDPNMPKMVKNAFILTMNVSLEYEKTEVNMESIHTSAEQREQMVVAERKFIDDRVRKIIDFKRTLCSGDKADYGFVVINQKGVDPPSLDMLAKEGILALRRAKRRNMERITLACGGIACNSVDDLTPDVVGFAKKVYEHVLGETKYTFVEGVENPFSVTILIKGPNEHSIKQVKDAVRDGLRAVKNTITDKAVVVGAGAFELGLHVKLMQYANSVKGRAKLGVQAFAEALLVIPKTLASNSGFDQTDCILALIDAHNDGDVVGIDLDTGDPMDPESEGVWDLYRSKRQIIHSATVLAQQLLLVDEVLQAGVQGR